MTRFELLLQLIDGSTPDTCTPWPGAITTRGYGQLKHDGRVQSAHRLSFTLYHKTNCEQVRHVCCNRLCVNPHHLLAGDQATNMQDMVRDGNSQRGIKHWGNKLTPGQVLDIRVYRESHAAAAAAYGVSVSTIRDIRSGRKWKWLTT